MSAFVSSWATASVYPPGAGAGPKNLTRSDFKKIELKGQANRWYYSFTDLYLDIEITLEPCLNGFCVGFWKNSDEALLSKKICTNLQEMIYKEEEDLYKEKKGEIPKDLCDSLRQKEIMFGILERSEKAWDKALSIANQLYRRKRNEETLRKWKILKDKAWVEEDPGTATWTFMAQPGYDVTVNPYWNSTTVSIDPKYYSTNVSVSDLSRTDLTKSETTSANSLTPRRNKKERKRLWGLLKGLKIEEKEGEAFIPKRRSRGL